MPSGEASKGMTGAVKKAIKLKKIAPEKPDQVLLTIIESIATIEENLKKHTEEIYLLNRDNRIIIRSDKKMHNIVRDLQGKVSRILEQPGMCESFLTKKHSVKRGDDDDE